MATMQTADVIYDLCKWLFMGFLFGMALFGLSVVFDVIGWMI